MRLPRLLDHLIVRAGFSSLGAWADAASVSRGSLYQCRARGERPGASIVRRMLAVTREPIDAIAFSEAVVIKEDRS